MGNLKEIRVRISSIQSTQKTTSAMKMVSAAKLRRAQTAIIGLRPYSNKLKEILHDLASSPDSVSDIPLFEKRQVENVVLVAISSNRGLCGGFNMNIVKTVQNLVDTNYSEQYKAGKVKLICIGKKAKEQLQKKFEVIHYNESLLDHAVFSEVAEIAESLMQGFIHGSIDKVDIIYNQFLNPATQKLSVEDYLPIRKLDISENSKTNYDYIFEPSKQAILEELIPKIIKLQLYKALIDSIASEHGARMTAMHQATDNASEILKELRLKYNNARQSAITNELIEIVSGAEALNND